ncbi:MAG TPA: ABC transporter ATP-binding protein, partial [Rhizobiales bacterium]|nr:ABC transporter ATP-binding protein [Hyphomicrobiales bacterium]
MLFGPTSKGRERPLAGRWGSRGSAAVTIAARLTFDNVARSFGSVHALRGVSLDISPGEIVCLLGPSGCGKTTLLRLTAGLERPTAGRILINDLVVGGREIHVPPEQRGVGLMFQDFALFPHLTLLENTAFGLNALAREDARKVAHSALERVGLAKYADEYPHILSGGEQQRVALARAIAPRPGILMMDEPFSGLDTRLRDEMREETLTILRETSATCMLVTHSSEEAMLMGNRVALMREGLLVQVGTAEELYHAPADIHAARMFSDLNEFPVIAKAGKVDTPFGKRALKGVASGSEAVACVRQRDVRIVPAGRGQAGRILSTRFLGETALLEIGVQGLDE